MRLWNDFACKLFQPNCFAYVNRQPDGREPVSGYTGERGMGEMSDWSLQGRNYMVWREKGGGKLTYSTCLCESRKLTVES